MGRVTFNYRTLANFEAEWLLTRILCTKKPWQIWNILVNKTPHSNQNFKKINKKVVQSLPPKFLREITIFPWKNNNNKNIKERKGKKKVEREREREREGNRSQCSGRWRSDRVRAWDRFRVSKLPSPLPSLFSVFAFFGLGFCSIQHSTWTCPFTRFILFFFFSDEIGLDFFLVLKFLCISMFFIFLKR